jgi:hypothetical protein
MAFKAPERPFIEGDGNVWVINGHNVITKFIIAYSYFFVCSFAIIKGPVS